MSTRMLRGLIFAGVAIVLAAGIIFALRHRSTSSISFTILFDEADGLSAGSKVVHKGILVGDVKTVTFTPDNRVAVKVRVNRTENFQVPANCTGYITDNTLVNVTGRKLVELLVPAASAPPMENGGTVQGVDSWMDLQVWKAKNYAERFFDSHQEEISEGMDKLRLTVQSVRAEIAETDVNKVLGDLQELAVTVVDGSTEALKTVDDKLETLEGEVEALKRTLEKAGESVDAEEVEAVFEDLKQKIAASLEEFGK